jgi:RHS repeat-associated protein
MRWVLMLFVILAAVMGGEARAVVVMGRAVVSERVVGAEMVEERAEALRIESERASRGMVREVEEVAGLVDAGPLVLWFPGGLAVARSDCLSGTGTTGCRRVSSTAWRYDLADNRVARTETEERRAANSTSWVRTAAADQRCLYRNAAGTGPNGRNQLSQSWETRTRWDAESGAPLELSEQTVSYRYDPKGNRTRRTTRLWKQARTTGSAAWPVPLVTDTDEALEWDGENRLTGMWRGPWKEELAQVPFEALVREAVAGSTVWRWGYDHRSRRVQRDEPGSGGERLRTVTVFAGGTSAAEYTETAAAGSAWTVPPAPTVQHVRGPDLGGGTKGLLYSLRNGLPTFNRYNGRGDVVAQSDIDGTTTWAASYQADGRRTAEAGTNVERHRACTKEEDPTGLLNEGFRYRDMETGTFISRDPLGLVDGPNVYCYVRQNPWTMWDPEGLESYSWYKGGWLRQNLVDPVYNTGNNFRADPKTTLTGLGTGMIDGALDLAYLSQPKLPFPSVVSRASEQALSLIKNLVDTTAADLVGVDPDSSTFRDANTTGAILLPMPGGAASTAAVRGATAAVRGAKALAGIGALAKAIATAPLKESAQLAAKPIVRELAEKAAAKGGAGAARAARFGDNWQSVSLKETISTVAGDAAVVTKTASGKVIYTHPETGVQVVHDVAGNYFRVENPAAIGSRRYLDQFGKLIPDNVPLVKPRGSTEIGVPKDVRNALTHFNNAD